MAETPFPVQRKDFEKDDGEELFNPDAERVLESDTLTRTKYGTNEAVQMTTKKKQQLIISVPSRNKLL